MRFMILRKADPNTEAGALPNQELLAAMGQYMEDMARAGILLAGEGLRPTSEGVRVKFSRGKPTVTDGPFAEAKELIAGWSIIQVNSMEEAIEWVKRWPGIDGDGEVELEIRRLYEADDFGAEFTPELGEKEERVRAQVAGSQQR
ncbi:MAG TPA: YciI family protein [Gemmatimonadales bacterium]|nr:YciI family protein [Gemmatimonadales bacterium]